MYVLIEFFVASVIRLVLMLSTYRQEIADRVEVSTLLNSWKRMTEGVVLYREGSNPYVGDIFHETPLALVTFDVFLKHWGEAYTPVLFIVTDLYTALVLYETASIFMKEMRQNQEDNKDKYAKGVECLMLKDHDFSDAPGYVMSVYLFNPFTILNCVGYTTTTFSSLLLAIVFWAMAKRYRLIACTALAIVVFQTFYPIVLIVPVCINIAKGEKKKTLSVIFTCTIFTIMLAGLTAVSFHIVKDWSFVNSIHITVLTVPDLRPNIGLFWYFFTEMFEHFRTLFIFSFQLNATLLYLGPLSLRFHREPMLLATSLIALVSVFKSYPSVGDVGFYLSLLPMWKHLYTNMQQSFLIACSVVVTSVLGPTLWHLWIYSRSANANFYFGVTLAFATAQIFLVTDLLFSFIRREFTLKHGIVEEDSSVKLKLLLD